MKKTLFFSILFALCSTASTSYGKTYFLQTANTGSFTLNATNSMPIGVALENLTGTSTLIWALNNYSLHTIDIQHCTDYTCNTHDLGWNFGHEISASGTATGTISMPEIIAGDYYRLYTTGFTGSYMAGNTSNEIPYFTLSDTELYTSTTQAQVVQVYPYNGGTFKDPSNWVVNLINLEPSKIYYIRIYWTTDSFYGSSTETSYFDDSIYINDASNTNQALVQIPKKYSALISNGTSSVTSSVWISTNPNLSMLDSNISTPINFTVDRDATLENSEAESRAGPFNTADDDLTKALQSGSAYCGDRPALTDIGGGISYGFCLLIRGLLVPPDSLTQISISTINSFKKVPPFSIIYDTLDLINQQIAQEPDSLPALKFQFHIANQTSSITVASPTFLEDTFGKPTTNIIFNMIIVSFALATLTIVWVSINKFI